MTTPLFPVFSKAPPQGQCPSRKGIALACAALAMLAACGRHGEAVKPNTPSGEPVPRYVTLKAAPVNARGGPGEDYKALWQYRARGLPLQVVEETQDWRRVCDPEGGLGWVRATSIDPRRAVMRTADSDLALRARPAEDARVTAMLAGHAVADLVLCKGGWCKISVDHATGWVRPAEVWGAADAPQCR